MFGGVPESCGKRADIRISLCNNNTEKFSVVCFLTTPGPSSLTGTFQPGQYHQLLETPGFPL